MFSRTTRTIGTVLAAGAVTATMALVAPAAAVAGPGAAPSARATYGQHPPDKDHSRYVRLTAHTDVLMRTGPSTSCPAVGQAERGDVLDYYCYAGPDGNTWTYYRDTTRRLVGWSTDSLLPNYGSFVRC